MNKSRTQQALDWLRLNAGKPGVTPAAAAVRFGIKPSGVYKAIKRISEYRYCHTCGQVLRR